MAESKLVTRKNQPTKPEQAGERGELTPLDAIRTETVLSRLPMHNLSKKGDHAIRIIRRRQEDGKRIELYWKPSPNPEFGEPRQLAYKLDTLVVNRRIDEVGRPLPRIIRLGSLRSVAQELGLGGDTASVKKALYQNASLFISFKFTYRAADGREEYVEGGTTRYNLFLRGSRLQDGTVADTVYLGFNDPFFQILNSSPRRPLDYDYLKQLAPAPQRFYELVSFKMFAALKNGHPHARMTYSEYCTFAPQTRYYDRKHVQKQMYKVHRPHIQSGYITEVKYDKTSDEEGNPDWSMFYGPGPKARVEYEAFYRSSCRSTSRSSRALSKGRRGIASAEVDSQLLQELTARGILEPKARELLLDPTPEHSEHVADCLDYWDSIQRDKTPGLLVDFLRKKLPLPSTFESRQQRRQRETAEAKRRQLQAEHQRLELAYEDYKRQEVERYIAEQLPVAEYQQLLAAKKQDLKRQYTFWAQRPEELERFAHRAVGSEIAKRLTLPTFEEFCRLERQKKASERHDAPKGSPSTETAL